MRVALSTAAAVVLTLIAAPAAAAAIGLGEVAPMPSAVTADSCDPGTYAVTSTAVPPRYEIPGDGVLTSWRTYATIFANVGPERLKVLHPVSAGSFKVVAASAYANSFSTIDGAEVSFATRIPVIAGDLIALGVGPVSATQSKPHCRFNHDSAVWSSRVGLDDPPDLTAVLPWGAPNPSSATRVSIGATLEPDLDRDGFGDETQDLCTGAAGNDHGCPPAAPPPPSGPAAPPPLVAVSGLTISPTAFRAASSGPSVTNRRSYGAKVAFTLNQAASVRFVVTRSTTGRAAAGRRCVATTRRNRHAHRCARTVTLAGAFSRAGVKGANSFRFSGRAGGKRLGPGRYRLLATPAANGHRGAPHGCRFRIVS
jgi:hypothetical protein